MKVIAVIQADLEVTPIGTKSRLAQELCGIVVLRRTVERLARVKKLEGIHIMCPAAQQERCRRILQGTAAIVQPYNVDPPPWAKLVETARKWSLDGWRGGIGGAMLFDECTDCRIIARLLDSVEAGAVMVVPPAAVLIDPTLVDELIEHRESAADEVRITFMQTVPGLSGLLADATLVREIGGQHIPIGWVFGYKPDAPQKDLALQPCCCPSPSEARYARGRVIADTERSMEMLTALLREHDDPCAVTTGRWLTRREAETIEPLPREVEIELTTDDPYPNTVLRPRGERVGRRGPIDLNTVELIAREIARYDDALLVLGGFGDPLRHPQFSEILECIVSVRPYGICVRTSGVDLTDARIADILRYDVDVVNVVLDAWTPELYARLQSPNDPALADLEGVKRAMDKVTERCRETKSVKPILIPEMTKAKENVHELDAFHDGWMRHAGAVNIVGVSHHGNQVEDRGVMNMAPSARVGCRRIRSRCLVLADGRVAVCDQDFRGLHTAGRIGEQSLEEIWTGAEFDRIRQAHRCGQFDPTPICAACDEWHRP